MRSLRTVPEAGFSLVEVLVSSALGAFLLTGFLSMATFQVSTTRDQTTQIDLQQSVRDVAEMFAREVRRAGANPTCATNIEALEFASSYMLKINSDLNGNGTIGGNDEQVTYLSFGDTFRRFANNNSETLLSNVDWGDSRIRYFDANGVEISAPFYGLSSAQRMQVRRIQFTVDLEKTMSTGETIRAQAASDINLRNRFFIKAAGC